MDKFESLRQWLHANMPSKCSEGAYYDINKTLRKKLQLAQEDTRIKLAWKEDLAVKLGLNSNDVIRAVNTIVREMEQALMRGDKIILDNFGSMMVSELDSTRNTITFIPDKTWMFQLNPPIKEDATGLKFKASNRKITRRV
jgi:nucleoid DNA-binding protein